MPAGTSGTSASAIVAQQHGVGLEAVLVEVLVAHRARAQDELAGEVGAVVDRGGERVAIGGRPSSASRTSHAVDLSSANSISTIDTAPRGLLPRRADAVVVDEARRRRARGRARRWPPRPAARARGRRRRRRSTRARPTASASVAALGARGGARRGRRRPTARRRPAPTGRSARGRAAAGTPRPDGAATRGPRPRARRR